MFVCTIDLMRIEPVKGGHRDPKTTWNEPFAISHADQRGKRQAACHIRCKIASCLVDSS